MNAELMSLSLPSFTLRSPSFTFTGTPSGRSTSVDAIAVVALVGLSDSSGDRTVAQDGIAIQYTVDSDAGDQEIRFTEADSQGFGVNQTDIRTSVSVETQYVEIMRTSETSVTTNIYSDSGYRNLTDTLTKTIPSTITNVHN